MHVTNAYFQYLSPPRFARGVDYCDDNDSQKIDCLVCSLLLKRELGSHIKLQGDDVGFAGVFTQVKLLPY